MAFAISMPLIPASAVENVPTIVPFVGQTQRLTRSGSIESDTFLVSIYAYYDTPTYYSVQLSFC